MLTRIVLLATIGTLCCVSGLPLELEDVKLMEAVKLEPQPSSSFLPPVTPTSKSGRDGALFWFAPELIAEVGDMAYNKRSSELLPQVHPVYPRVRSVGVGESVTAVAGSGTGFVTAGQGRKAFMDYFGQSSPYSSFDTPSGLGFGGGNYDGYGYGSVGQSSPWQSSSYGSSLGLGLGSDYYGSGSSNRYGGYGHTGHGHGHGQGQGFGSNYYSNQGAYSAPYIPSSSLFF